MYKITIYNMRCIIFSFRLYRLCSLDALGCWIMLKHGFVFGNRFSFGTERRIWTPACMTERLRWSWPPDWLSREWWKSSLTAMLIRMLLMIPVWSQTNIIISTKSLFKKTTYFEDAWRSPITPFFVSSVGKSALHWAAAVNNVDAAVDFFEEWSE